MLTVIGLLSSLWTLYLSYRSGVGFDIFVSLLLSKVWSFLEWFLYTGPVFAYSYPIDKRFFYDRLRLKTSKRLSAGGAAGAAAAPEGMHRTQSTLSKGSSAHSLDSPAAAHARDSDALL